MPTATAPASAAAKPKPKKPKTPKTQADAGGQAQPTELAAGDKEPKPKLDAAKPKPEAVKPKPEAAKPKPEAAKPKPEAAKLKPEAAKPKSAATKPKQAAAAESKQPKVDDGKNGQAGSKNPKKSDEKGPKGQPAKKSESNKASGKPSGESKATERDVGRNGAKPERNGVDKDVKAINGESGAHSQRPKIPVSLQVFNSLDVQVCAALFENLLDFSPSIGYALANLRPYKSPQHLVDQLNAILDSLPATYLQGFLKRFNELGLIAKSKLTKEQKCCVGLEKLSESAREELSTLYSQYREKFGFPFVVSTRGLKADELVSMVQAHLSNDVEQELLNGVKELKKIASLRLQEVISA